MTNHEPTEAIPEFTHGFDDLLSFWLKQVPPRHRKVRAEFSRRLALMAAHVAIQSDLDPYLVLSEAAAELPVMHEASRQDYAVELLERPGMVAPPLDDSEFEELAESLRDCIATLALSGVPFQKIAGVLMISAAQVLVNGGHSKRLTALQFGMFGRAINGPIQK